MAEIDKSMKLVFNEFQRAVTEVPLEVYYQTLTSTQYSSSGFQFNIKQPGTNALLDCDVWIKYKIALRGAANIFQNMFGRVGGNRSAPLLKHRIALRGGNCVARCLQNLSIQINNSTLNVQPYRYVDVLNRIYVSNDQSEHEFSGSGGRFDEGNHGARTDNLMYQPLTALAGDNSYTSVAAGNAQPVVIYVHTGYTPNPAVVNATDVTGNCHLPYPLMYEFYNPGFSRRFAQFAYNGRTFYNRAWNGTHGAATPNLDPNANEVYRGSQADDNPVVAGSYYYTIEIYERLPIPIFKMYSTDGTYGVIPNINQMQIQGNFLSQFIENFIRGVVDVTGAVNAVANLTIDWNKPSSSDATLYLRWYTPPVNMSVPRELSIPYPKINTWSVTQAIAAPNADVTLDWYETDIQQYNITLEAIPDLLLIYVKYAPFNYTLDTPDDYLFELLNLVINIDNASGKLNQITSMDLYNKWKKIIKHSDAKIIGYNEWRKYCFVACLQPEDYGVRYGPGYSNQTVLGFSCKARNWHTNHSAIINANGGQEEQPNAAGINAEVFVTSIYNKNRFIIRADGTANQEMLKIAADFNMLAPPGVLPPASA